MSSTYLTFPVTTLRINFQLHAFLCEHDYYDRLRKYFGKQFKLVFEDAEKINFDKNFKPSCKHPVISLAKHIPADYNLNLSRTYTTEGRFLGFFSCPTGLTLEEAVHDLQITEKEVIIFDEDIGGGYLISLLQKELKNEYGIDSTVETFLRFDPTIEDILDLKDFIYKYSDTSGLVIQSPRGLERIPYMISPKILCQFTPARFKYAWELQQFFWEMSRDYHKYVSFNRTYEADCCRQLGIPYENASSLH